MAQIEARKLEREEAAKIFSELTFCENPKQREWIKNCENNRDFYYGKQITDEESETLRERGQYDIVINKIRKSIRGLVGLLSGSLPKYGAFSYGAENSVKTDIINKILDHSWNNSGGLSQFKAWLKKAAIANIAYMHVAYISKEKKCKTFLLSYDDVIVSPNSRDRMFRDAYLVGIKKYVPIQHIEKLYGIPHLSTVIPGDLTYDKDADPSSVDKEERAERKLFLDKLYSGDRQYVLVYELYRKQYVGEGENIKIRIKRQTVLGHEHVYEEFLPEDTKEYPIVPLYVEDTENPYKIGEVHFLIELQRFINKVFGVVIANAQTLSNPKLFLEENSIKGTEEEFMNNYAVPGSVNFIRQGAQPPVIVQGQPLNQAFFGLYLEAKQELEWNTIPDEILGYGDRQGSQEYKPALLERREAVIESFSDFMSTIDSAMVQLARVVIECIRTNYSEEKLLSICDPQGKYYKYMEFKNELKLDLDEPETIEGFIQRMTEEGADEETIAKLLDEATDSHKFYTSFHEVLKMDMSEANDIYIIAGSYSSTRGLAMLKLVMELQRIGAVDPSTVLKYSPVDDKDELISRYDNLMIAQSKIDNLTAQLEQYEKILTEQQKENANLKADQHVVQRKVQQRYQESMVKLKAYLHKHKDALQTKEKMIEVNALMKDLEKAISEVREAASEVQERGQEEPRLIV